MKIKIEESFRIPGTDQIVKAGQTIKINDLKESLDLTDLRRAVDSLEVEDYEEEVLRNGSVRMTIFYPKVRVDVYITEDPDTKEGKTYTVHGLTDDGIDSFKSPLADEFCNHTILNLWQITRVLKGIKKAIEDRR